MLKGAVAKGLSVVDDLVKCKDKLKVLCGATSAFQIEKEVHDIIMFSQQVEYELKNKEQELNATVVWLAEINSVYQVKIFTTVVWLAKINSVYQVKILATFCRN